MNSQLLKLFLNTLNIKEFQIYINTSSDTYSVDFNFSMEDSNSVSTHTYTYRSKSEDKDNTIFKVLRQHFDNILDMQQASKYFKYYPIRHLEFLETELRNLGFIQKKHSTSSDWVKEITTVEELINIFESLLNIKKHETIKKFKDMYE